MAKKIDTKNLILFELAKLENKVNEFQTYLELNPITAQVTKGNEIILSEENQDKLHKEIVIQIKMQSALFEWLPLLEKLRESENNKELETRGNLEVNGLFKRNQQ
jgi:hypothetical protein